MTLLMFGSLGSSRFFLITPAPPPRRDASVTGNIRVDMEIEHLKVTVLLGRGGVLGRHLMSQVITGHHSRWNDSVVTLIVIFSSHVQLLC